VFTACSGDGDSGASKKKAGDVCNYAGESACGFSEQGKAAVLMCKVTEDKGRVWVTEEACPAGCTDGECLPYEIDVTDISDDVDASDINDADLPPPCVPK